MKGDHHERGTLLQQLAQVSSDRYRTWPHEFARTAGPRYQSRRHPQRCSPVGCSLNSLFLLTLSDTAPADDAGVSMSGRSEALCWRSLSSGLTPAFFTWLHCSKVCLMCSGHGYLGFDRSDALPPANLRIQTARSSSHGASVGAGARPLECLFGSFRKTCRTSSCGRLFRFQDRHIIGSGASCGSCSLSEEGVTPTSHAHQMCLCPTNFGTSS